MAPLRTEKDLLDFYEQDFAKYTELFERIAMIIKTKAGGDLKQFDTVLTSDMPLAITRDLMFFVGDGWLNVSAAVKRNSDYSLGLRASSTPYEPETEHYEEFTERSSFVNAGEVALPQGKSFLEFVKSRGGFKGLSSQQIAGMSHRDAALHILSQPDSLHIKMKGKYGKVVADIQEEDARLELGALYARRDVGLTGETVMEAYQKNYARDEFGPVVWWSHMHYGITKGAMKRDEMVKAFVNHLGKEAVYFLSPADVYQVLASEHLFQRIGRAYYEDSPNDDFKVQTIASTILAYDPETMGHLSTTTFLFDKMENSDETNKMVVEARALDSLLENGPVSMDWGRMRAFQEKVESKSVEGIPSYLIDQSLLGVSERQIKD